MKNRHITPAIRELFAEIQNLKSQGFWSDSISIDKVMITANVCPKCLKSLIYQGWSNREEYRAYGICEPCEFAKFFWKETVRISSFKKKVCRMSAK